MLHFVWFSSTNYANFYSKGPPIPSLSEGEEGARAQQGMGKKCTWAFEHWNAKREEGGREGGLVVEGGVEGWREISPFHLWMDGRN